MQDTLLFLADKIKKLGLRKAVKEIDASQFKGSDLEEAVEVYLDMLSHFKSFEFIEKQLVGLIELELEDHGIESPFEYIVDDVEEDNIYVEEDVDGYKVEYYSADEIHPDLKDRQLDIDTEEDDYEDDIELKEDVESASSGDSDMKEDYSDNEEKSYNDYNEEEDNDEECD